ncbi:MAG: Ig-like domain-containing protein, partial [Bacteroidales bacterium]|nr:Ig-like domain-containing protein [Bacteroidales bacterium]
MGFMPSFKDKLAKEDKWNITFYVKSFDENFKITGEEIKTKNGVIDLKKDDSAKTLIATASIVDKNGISKPSEGVEINFFVKRIFGNLPIGETVITDQNGTAVFKFPDDIPGDKNGKIKIIAKFKDSDAYGTAMKSAELNWGTHLHFVNPVLERTLWGPNNRVPIWLLLSFLIVTGGVWLTILYVVFQITQIKKAGK